MVALLALFAVLSLAVVGGTVALLDLQPAREPERMLAPLWGPIVTILVAGAHRIATACRRRDAGRGRQILTAGPAVALALVALLSVSRAVPWLGVYLHEGHGFAARRWTGSELIGAVRAQPSSRPVFSNVTTAVYWLAGRPAGPISGRLDPRTGGPNPGHDAELAALGRRLAREDGRIAHFDVRPGPWPTVGELVSRLHLVILERAPDGWLLGPG